MRLIEFNGFNDKPITVASSKILACAPANDNNGKPCTSIFLDAPEPNAEFLVNEEYKQVAFRLKTEVFEKA